MMMGVRSESLRHNWTLCEPAFCVELLTAMICLGHPGWDLALLLTGFVGRGTEKVSLKSHSSQEGFGHGRA